MQFGQLVPTSLISLDGFRSAALSFPDGLSFISVVASRPMSFLRAQLSSFLIVGSRVEVFQGPQPVPLPILEGSSRTHGSQLAGFLQSCQPICRVREVQTCRQEHHEKSAHRFGPLSLLHRYMMSILPITPGEYKGCMD